jgi:phosphoenolpyruvate phosphomutase
MWSSSLTDATTKGKPDIEALDISARLRNIHDIFEVTTKPLLFDADTGGPPEHFHFTVRSLERIGVSAVVIEDKTGLKRNSLLGNQVVQEQASVEDFCAKIRVGKSAQVTDDFMLIARVESLILERGMDDALLRTAAYIDAGADGILIHSRLADPGEILRYCDHYRALDRQVPLFVVPSSYPSVTEATLADAGVNVVIYANQLLRAAFPAMDAVAHAILAHGRSLESEAQCMPIKDILNLVPVPY